MDLDTPRPERGWSSRRTATPRGGTAVLEPELHRSFCASCWGAGVILVGGEWGICASCLGTRDIPSIGDHLDAE